MIITGTICRVFLTGDVAIVKLTEPYEGRTCAVIARRKSGTESIERLLQEQGGEFKLHTPVCMDTEDSFLGPDAIVVNKIVFEQDALIPS